MQTVVSRFAIKWQVFILGVLASVWLVGQAVLVWVLGDALEVAQVKLPVLVSSLVGVLIVLGLTYSIGQSNARRAEQIVRGLQAMSQGDLTHRMNLCGKDEFAWMAWEYKCARESVVKIVEVMLGNATQLASAAEELSAVTDQSRMALQRQSAETEQVAAAMNQMSATVQEVAGNTAGASDAANDADTRSSEGNAVVKRTVAGIAALAEEVDHTAQVVAKLKEETRHIGSVLDVIRDIAEQTNLLALNAAIEAARAGEQGRGFAVVADEVRSLASRTQQSTQEIQSMITRLQAGAEEAVQAMDTGREKAEVSVHEAEQAGLALDAITDVVNVIRQQNAQIAAAADEQSKTAEYINQSIVNITTIAQETNQGAENVASASEELARLAVDLQAAVGRFRVA